MQIGAIASARDYVLGGQPAEIRDENEVLKTSYSTKICSKNFCFWPATCAQSFCSLKKFVWRVGIVEDELITRYRAINVAVVAAILGAQLVNARETKIGARRLGVRGDYALVFVLGATKLVPLKQKLVLIA